MAYTYIAVLSLEWIWMDYFAHWASGRRGDKKRPVPKVEKNVTLMNILRELLSTAKTVEVEGKHLSQRLKGSWALQLSALLRQSQHTPAKLFLNNHPAVLKAVKFSFFSVCYLCSSQFGGQVQFGWCGSSTLTKTCCWQVEVRRGCSTVFGFQSGHFVPCVKTSPVRMMMILSVSFVLCYRKKNKKTWLQKIFYDFSLCMDERSWKDMHNHIYNKLE